MKSIVNLGEKGFNSSLNAHELTYKLKPAFGTFFQRSGIRYLFSKASTFAHRSLKEEPFCKVVLAVVVPKKRNPKRRSNIVWLTRRLRYRIEFTFDSAPRSGCALQGPKRPHRQSGPIVGSPALLDTNGFQYYSFKSLVKGADVPACQVTPLLLFCSIRAAAVAAHWRPKRPHRESVIKCKRLGSTRGRISVLFAVS